LLTAGACSQVDSAEALERSVKNMNGIDRFARAAQTFERSWPPRLTSTITNSSSAFFYGRGSEDAGTWLVARVVKVEGDQRLIFHDEIDPAAVVALKTGELFGLLCLV
jgi:hypothetical protein